MDTTTYLVSYFIGAFVWAIIWGFAAKTIATNKGYEYESTKWFWLGFFFAFIAVIIIATKPDNNGRSRYNSSNSSGDYSVYETVPYNGWKCQNCGRVHQGYESTCVCGMKKDGTQYVAPSPSAKNKPMKDNPQNSEKIKAVSETEKIKIIKEYKELLDSNIITQEEFAKKKSQLLWEDIAVTTDDAIENVYTKSETDNTQNGSIEKQAAVALLPSDREYFGICPKCGASQRNNRKLCYKCGVPFINDN